MPVYSRLSDHSRRSMRPVGRLLLCRVVRVGLVKVFPTSRGLSLSGYLLVFRVVYRLPPGDPCCSFGFHLTDVPSGQLSELSSQLPKLTAHSSVFSSIKSKRGFPDRCSKRTPQMCYLTIRPPVLGELLQSQLISDSNDFFRLWLSSDSSRRSRY